MGKTLVVVRVSTDEQDIDSQKKELIGFLNSKGLKEKDFIYLEAVGASAVKLNDKYKEFIEKIKDYCTTGKVNSIAFWHLNRLGRNDRVLSEMLYFFIDHKIQVYVKEPSFNLLDENKEPNIVSKMLWEMFSILIKSETDELKAKTKRGMDFKKGQGLYVGGTIKYGYKIVNSQKVRDEEEVNTIKEIREKYATGEFSLRKLYLYYKGTTLRNKDITIYTIETLLGNSYKEFTSKVVNDKIDHIKRLNNKNATKKQKGTRVYLANKLIKCPSCGNNLGYNKGYYLCFRHQAQWKTPEKICNFSSSIKAEPLDNLLWSIVKDIDSKKANILERDNVRKLTKDKLALEKRLTAIETYKANKLLVKRSRILNNYENSLITETERDKKLKEVDTELIETEKNIDSLKAHIDVITSKINLLNTGTSSIDYSTFSDDDKYNLVHTHINKILVTDGENRYKKNITIYDKYDRVYEYNYNSRDSSPFMLISTRINTTRLFLEAVNKRNNFAKSILDLEYEVLSKHLKKRNEEDN